MYMILTELQAIIGISPNKLRFILNIILDLKTKVEQFGRPNSKTALLEPKKL